ncbi:death-inducer obliterator 1 [Leguminivora glycinivorella]|uniref:death-inducer obliterator 1 n=1 Tax=Leguminivora glycinivorella TaxID=1035111 RepID=UPI00200FB34D|nr:death-inducer obliterator 1 [Leguminivora glycinivorella]
MFTESQESWNSEDDPYRLWCICKQPHNNRFMICCDSCEDWFHGKCVNITKAMGQQMEEDGIEWRCPNCVKKTKPTPKTITNKMTIQKKQEVESDQSPPLLVSPPASKVLSSKTSCIVCKKPARASSIYCSDACILKHAQDSLGNQTPGKGDGDTHHDKSKSDSRVIVYERKSGRVLAGPNAPTPENLKVWLQKNPTFEVVRPGALSAIKPNVMKKKAAAAATKEPTRIQTTLNFERIPKKQGLQTKELKEIPPKLMYSREEPKTMTSPKTPVTPKSQQPQFPDTPRASTSGLRTIPEPRKLVRTANRSVNEKTPKAPSVSPAAARKKDTPPDTKSKMKSAEPIRDNVRKALQEQMTARMAENTGPKFSENEIRQFAYDTEFELHELFRDVGMKYKAKYRSLMFNIKDRKNLSLWQKICDKTITPKQLVRLSPEELASQELAQWRDKEAKYQLELIKKSELDLLAASKTYVLKTHKGEEVMETKESVSTELDPNVPVEDLVSALNDSTATEEPSKDNSSETAESPVKADSKKHSSKKSAKDSHSKMSSRESKRDSESRKSRSSRRKSDIKDKDERHTRRSEKRTRAASKDRSRRDSSKEKESERSRRRSRSRTKSKKRSKSREHSRSLSQSRDESRLRRHSRRSKSKEPSRRRNSSRSKHRSSTDDKAKHRSRSQEVVYTKSKNESTDSDSLERPKSAMLKEAHPEYDPHEPMITSAFSEEDLRKSRDDVYEDSYNKNEIGDYSGTEYDPSKTFAVDASLLPGSTFASPKPSSEKLEKVAEAESDQEPSSTVEHSSAPVWNGCINMVDVARFYVAAHEVSGTAADIEEDLSTELDIVGRINPDTVWDYISKMKRASNKDIIILKLQAANDEEKMQYIALYSYLSSRNRLGVVRVLNTTLVKDFYIVPLPAHTALPAVLLPLDGPEPALETRTHLLVAIVIRQRKKRVAAAPPAAPLPAKQVRRSSRKRSYTPPVLAAAAASYTPPASPRRRALPLPTAYTSPKLSTSVKDKIAATLASADDDEAYSPGSSTSSGSAPSSLRCKMEELNRQIEEQKQQIRKMTQADSAAAGEDEAYSPSRPMTPPGASAGVVPLADIALPSNLQEILATIKQRSEPAAADVDMRLPQQLP